MLWLGEARHTGIMPGMEPVVRAARPDDDAAAELLYVSAAPYYDRYAGGEARARRILAAVYPRDGHTASWEVCRVALVDGEVVGRARRLPGGPTDEVLARRFIRLTLRRVPPWRLPGLVRHLRAAAAVSPQPPRGLLYVDALAVAPGWRRRGVARALLAEADRLAAQPGAPRRGARHGDREPRGARALPAQRLPASAGCAPCPTSAAPAPSAARASSATSSRAT